MSARTLGHRADSAGVRGHSAGDIFPAVIMIKGSFNEGFTYHVLNHPRVDVHEAHSHYICAETTAACTPRF